MTSSRTQSTRAEEAQGPAADWSRRSCAVTSSMHHGLPPIAAFCVASRRTVPPTTPALLTVAIATSVNRLQTSESAIVFCKQTVAPATRFA